MGIVWGATFVGNNIGVRHVPALLMGGSRFFIAACVSGMLTFIYRGWHGCNRREVANSLIMGALMYGVGNACVSLAQITVSASVTAIVYAAMPIIVAFFDGLLPSGNRLSGWGWLGLCISLAGIVWLWLPNLALANKSMGGLLLLVVSSIFWSGGILYGKYHRRCRNIWADVTLQCLAAGLLQMTVGSAMGNWHSWHNNLPGWSAILFLALVGTVLGNGCFVYGLQNMPPAKMSTYSYINPISAMFFSWLVIGEAITGRMIFSTVVISLGVVLVQTTGLRQRKTVIQK